MGSVLSRLQFKPLPPPDSIPEVARLLRDDNIPYIVFRLRDLLSGKRRYHSAKSARALGRIRRVLQQIAYVSAHHQYYNLEVRRLLLTPYYEDHGQGDIPLVVLLQHDPYTVLNAKVLTEA